MSQELSAISKVSPQKLERREDRSEPTIKSALSAIPSPPEQLSSLTGRVNVLEKERHSGKKHYRDRGLSDVEKEPAIKKKKEEKSNSSRSIEKPSQVSLQLGNREIEFKATRVNPDQFRVALERLEKMAQSGSVVSKGSVNQEDHYLDHVGLKGSEYALYGKGEISKSFRIRREEATIGGHQNHSICVKVARKGKVESDHERREYELSVDDPKKGLEMFEQLGFSAEKIIRKTRTSFLYQRYEVVLDEVVGLKKVSSGSSYEQEFSSYILEVELKEGAEEISDIPKCLGEMKQFIEGVLGLTEYHQEQSGMEKYM